MKRTIFICLFLCFIISQASSQNYRNKVDSLGLHQHAIHLKLLSLLPSGLDMAYERKKSSNSTIYLAAGFFNAQNPWYYDSWDQNFYYANTVEMLGAKGEFSLRFYKKYTYDPDDLAKRLFVQPGVLFKFINLDFQYDETIQFGSSSATIDDRSYSAQALGIYFLLGSQVIITEGIPATVYFGPMITRRIGGEIAANEAHIPLVNPYINSVGIKFGVDIGFSFGNE